MNKGTKTDRATKFKWRKHDWDQLRRELGTVASMDEGPEDVAPDTLKIAAEVHSHACTVVVVLQPSSLTKHSVWSLQQSLCQTLGGWDLASNRRRLGSFDSRSPLEAL